MKKILIFLIIIFNLVSCDTNENKISNQEINYDDYLIELNEIYNIEKDQYAVYFSSAYCPACNSLVEHLNNFLLLENKCFDNFYIVDITNTNQDDFNKMKSGNAMFDEDIISSSLNATSLQETYFKTAPCIYVFNKIENVNKLTDLLLNYQDVYDVFTLNIYAKED